MSSNFEETFSNAKAYEYYVGRWSRLVAQQFLNWLNVAPQKSWLDVGAGTGILSKAILEQASPAKVLGLDFSKDYINYAQNHVQDERLEFQIGDALNLPYESPQFDIAVSGLVLNFLPDPEEAVRKMAQAVRESGMVAAYVWDYAGQMEMMRHFWDAAIALDPAAIALDGGNRFSICEPNNLKALFEKVGLTEVEVIPIDIPTHFKDFDDYWLPFLGAQGSVAKYIHGISEEARGAIRERLREQLPRSADGGIPLVARAWAVKGRK